MTNVNLETRVAALEAEVQEIRALLREAATNIVALTQAQARTQQQIDANARSIAETDAIAKSNARSIQAWESRIEENRVEAEEERSELRVNMNNLSQNLDRLQGHVDELVRLSQRNEVEHELFRRRFEAIDPLTNGD